MTTIDFTSEENALHQLSWAVEEFKAIKNRNVFSLRMSKKTFEDIIAEENIEFVKRDDLDAHTGSLGTYCGNTVVIDNTLGYGIIVFDD